jgi:hypothetical protein
MKRIYEAVYSDRQTRETVCNASATALSEYSDAYGNKSDAQIYSTTLSRDVADRINWSNLYAANFEQLWTVEYEHPDVEAATLKENAQDALDCAVDNGLFDIDIGC